MFYVKLTLENFKNKGFNYPVRKTSICERRVQASALDINWNNRPTPKWSSRDVWSQRHPKVPKLLLQIEQLGTFKGLICVVERALIWLKWYLENFVQTLALLTTLGVCHIPFSLPQVSQMMVMLQDGNWMWFVGFVVIVYCHHSWKICSSNIF